MADLIDRQTAIETAIEAADEWDGGTSFSRDGIIERRLKMIPAVHVADIGKKAEGDCISRQMAIDALAEQMPESYTLDGSHPADEEIFKAQEVYADCIKTIEQLPAAQPEIIRCKDCKYMIDTGDNLMCDNAKGWVVATTSDFGCVLAERRTE